jgi:hypothetical protein
MVNLSDDSGNEERVYAEKWVKLPAFPAEGQSLEFELSDSEGEPLIVRVVEVWYNVDKATMSVFCENGTTTPAASAQGFPHSHEDWLLLAREFARIGFFNVKADGRPLH